MIAVSNTSPLGSLHLRLDFQAQGQGILRV